MALAIVTALVRRPAGAVRTELLPIIVTATPAPARNVAAAAPTPAQRWVVAFNQPIELGGTAMGAIPEPTAFTARWGDDWLQTEWDTGVVWVRTSDLQHPPAELADLQPTPTDAPAIIVVNVPRQPEAEPAPPTQAVEAQPTPDFYDLSTLPTPPPEFVAACQSAAGKRSVFGGGRP